MRIKPNDILYTQLPLPESEKSIVPVDLTDHTMRQHKEKILHLMRQENYDCIVVYGDREHGGNFGYLAGFEPRFEEAVIVLHANGKAYMLLGNEALRMAAYSRLEVTALHTPYFSLPNQPMEGERRLSEVFSEAGVTKGEKVGLVGWKMFTAGCQDCKEMLDVPAFITEPIRQIVGAGGQVLNASDLFIHPGKGARRIMNANEIAHYEFGAALASHCVFQTIQALEPGKTEMELAENLAAFGQPCTVQTICASGERFKNAVVAPRERKVETGDRFSTTMGLRGGLTNRVAYIAASDEDLPEKERDYLEKMAKPYFTAMATWYASVKIGLTGGALYDAIERAAPKASCGWKLNPGHLTSSEEWMSSPVYPDSEIELESGMMLQMDIILAIDGYGGCNAEDGIALADEALRRELADEYPSVWRRIQRRRQYMQQVLGIPLDDAVLPLSNIAGYVRPFLLQKEKALKLRIEDRTTA